MEGYSISEYIALQIKNGVKAVDVEAAIKSGGYIIFFDGYDEVETGYRTTVTNNIREIATLSERNYFVLTSREDYSLSVFNMFQRFSIQPLEIDESCDLLGRIDNNGAISSSLKLRIKNDKNLRIIQELLCNPLLTSLLYRTYDYGFEADIPYKKADFYAQIFEALYRRHDNTKAPDYTHKKRSGLDFSDFNALLRRIGFITLNLYKIEFERIEFIRIIEEQVLKCMAWLKTSGDDVIFDLTNIVPYFTDFNTKIKWIHKSFMEYFAALYICNDLKDKRKEFYNLLIRKPDIYYNIIDFCFEINIRDFREFVLSDLLKAFISDYESDLNKFDFREEDYCYRKSLLFVYELKLIYDNNYNEDSSKADKDAIIQKYLGNSVYRGLLFFPKNHFIIVYQLQSNNRLALIELLFNKKVNIFNITKKYSYTYYDYNIIDLPNGYYELNFKKTNLINKKEYFLYLNSLLIKNLSIRKFDYLKCKQVDNEITLEKEELYGNSFFLL